MLSQAREVHETLDSVAGNVSAALKSMNLEELQRSVAEAERQNIVTEDVQKAQGLRVKK